MAEDKNTERASRAISESSIPVVAIGASAGGLEPLELFFDSMPADSGCAFVVIQHLSPDFRSLMDELLARHSSMPIYRIEDGMQLEPNSIYLNTPRTVMTIKGNLFQVEKIDPQDVVYLPIDIFFKSLANDRGAVAIGLVFSGTGSDGTKGSHFIRAAGGKVLVQEPETTRFDSMPRSVISEGSDTMVASPPVLAQAVYNLLNNLPIEELSNTARLPITDPLSDVLSMLKYSHGTDFLQYKEATIHRRIERRAQMRGISDIDDYRDFLNTDPEELLDLYADLLIEVTEFFRDPAAFEVLQKKVIPELTRNLKDGSGLRVWVPGCASGEEAYSIAILLQEEARARGIYLHIKIMATDIHVRSMNQASSGVYNESALKNIPTDLVERYFDCADGQAQIKPNLRNMVFFSTHDVTRDPPFTRIDLISCRNLLIYLKDDAQEKVLNLLHFALRKDGCLFLGPSEHIGKIAHEFTVINEKWRVFKKRRDIKLLSAESIFRRTNVSPDLPVGLHRASNAATTPASQDETISFKRAHRAALEKIVARHAPPGFLLAEDGTIVHIFGNAGELIPLQAGSFSKKVADLIRPELKVVVTAALDHARHKEFTTFRRAAYVSKENQPASTYEVALTTLDSTGDNHNFLLMSIEKTNVVNSDDPSPALVLQSEITAIDDADALHQRIAILEHNLLSSEESLQSTIEELETSNEELQSTNEELMAANEEMQSTNEELHSVNEELYTVSAEHQRKNDELTERETDINVLLQSSKIGTLHLDKNLCLRRYTNNARAVFNILPQDVGRPINHITMRPTDQDILRLVYEANENNKTQETRVVVDQNVYLVRIMPYENTEGTINGVLLTVIDITDIENTRSQLSEINLNYQDIIENTDSFVVRWDAKTEEIVFCNEAYARRWETTKEALLGKNIVELRTNKSEQSSFRQSLADYNAGDAKSAILSATSPSGIKQYANIFTRAISRDGINIDAFQSNGFDCTSEFAYRETLEKLFAVFSNESLEYHEKLQSLLNIGLAFFDLDTAIISMVVGDTYEVTCVAGSNPHELETGTRLKLSDTICSAFVEKKAALAIDDLGASELNQLPCYNATGIESFIGASISTANGPYGTVSFSSQSKRGATYSQQEENFCLLMGGWIGFLIGHQEQIDFMRNQNEYYISLYLTIPTMMFLCDSDGLILSASDRLCHALQLEPHSVPGKNCFELLDVDNKDALREAVVEGNANCIPLTVRTGNNSIAEMELNSTFKTTGPMSGVRMVVLSDVSDRNAVLRQAEDQNRRLELANENLNQFAFIASHDLQEPLRKIQQFSNFLEEDLEGKLTGDAVYHLGVIVDASERMSTLIYDLLRYSGASQEELVKESVALDELLSEVQSELELPISESNAKLTVGPLPTVEGDSGLLRQLFVNLISNSIKYRAENREPTITVTAFGSSLQDGLEVADNGIGFDMEFVNRIFEPFNRLHNNNEYKGNGIGLAICTKVCEKHGWTLSAKSQSDVGSTFTIHFNPQQKSNEQINNNNEIDIIDG